MHKKMLSPKNITICGMFTALLCVICTISIGINILGVPATLQTFGMAFIGFTLGNNYAIYVCSIYLLLGFIGFPIFAHFTCGPAVLFGQNGGFLFGFLCLCFFSGLSIKISDKFKNQMATFLALILSFIGLICCHILGVLQFSFVCKLPLMKSFLLVSMPYLPKDILSVILAWICAKSVRKSLGGFFLPVLTNEK